MKLERSARTEPSRTDSRVQTFAAAVHVGSVDVNRSVTAKVVGSQTFGGEGFSGTGPKAGGPNYLLRFRAEQTVTVNTMAAGENAKMRSGLKFETL